MTLLQRYRNDPIATGRKAYLYGRSDASAAKFHAFKLLSVCPEASPPELRELFLHGEETEIAAYLYDQRSHSAVIYYYPYDVGIGAPPINSDEIPTVEYRKVGGVTERCIDPD